MKGYLVLSGFDYGHDPREEIALMKAWLTKAEEVRKECEALYAGAIDRMTLKHYRRLICEKWDCCCRELEELGFDGEGD